ncbi:MAG: hypothetical protein Q8R02_01300 [Hyphomonadaceae bacterium]|nr:hypothetical protein [Hyphomonadaceae bacterium]
MNDYPDRRPPSRVRAQLEAARTAGAWMPWAGAAMAVLLWGGLLIWLIASVGLTTLFAQPPLALAGAAAAVLTPGLAMIIAGIMARESARSSQANALVLTSARMLLDPIEHTRGEVNSVGEAFTRETQNVNRALAETRQRLDGLKHDIEASVTSALKAAEIVRADSEVLVHKMSSERQSMSQLAESLRNQSEALAKAIPRHAQMMSEAARAAQEQVRQADATLDQRLRGLEQTAGQLQQRIEQMDNMGAESRKRAQNLAGALMRLDEQLVQSTRMVESATKAGELATAATKSTAESLRDAVSDALGSALKATETINERSAQASEEARQAMVRLKEAGLQAEATTRTATMAARAHADETEKRISQLSDYLFRADRKAGNATESGLDRARQRIEKASLLIGQMKDDHGSSSVDDLVLKKVEVPVIPIPAIPLFMKDDSIRKEEPVRKDDSVRTIDDLIVRHEEPRPVEDLLLDRPAPPSVQPFIPPDPPPMRPAAPKPTASADFQPPPRPPVDNGEELLLQNIDPFRRPFGSPPSQGAQPMSRHDAIFGEQARSNADASSNPALSWRDLLTGIEEPPAHAREQTVGAMIDRLDRAGVRLGVVKASDLRRIASAAHQGDRQRRRAIRDVAPGEIQRVARLLDTDRDLQTAARTFIHSEEPDALRLLSMADRAREDAAPRLSAYLLLDAALGATI